MCIYPTLNQGTLALSHAIIQSAVDTTNRRVFKKNNDDQSRDRQINMMKSEEALDARRKAHNVTTRAAFR